MDVSKRICLFCGARAGTPAVYVQAAQELGREIARRGHELVYGGGHVGLMGQAADAVLAAKGRVIGVIPQGLVDKEVAHAGVTELIVTRSMHERKARMADLSDGFIAMPGGFGTLDELCEIVTWAQLGIHHKPIVLLNTDGYFDEFIRFLARAARDGFMTDESLRLLQMATTPAGALDLLRA